MHIKKDLRLQNDKRINRDEIIVQLLRSDLEKHIDMSENK